MWFYLGYIFWLVFGVIWLLRMLVINRNEITLIDKIIVTPIAVTTFIISLLYDAWRTITR